MKGRAALFTAVGIAVTLLCLLGISWIGPSGAFLNLVTPVPAAYLGMRFGLRSSLLVVGVTSLVLILLATPYTLVVYLGMFGAGSLLLPFFLRQRIAWDRAVLQATAGGVLATLVMVLFTVMVSGTALNSVVDQVIQAEVDQAMQIYRDSGFSEDQLQQMRQVIDDLAGFIEKTFYGLYAAVLLAVQALTLLFLKWLQREHYPIPGPLFAVWRLPGVLIWILIAAGFALVVPVAPLQLLGRNLLAVLLPCYFFQGMAVANSYLRQKTYPPLVKGLIYLLLLVLNPLPIIVTGVGVFDLWVDFRQPRQKK